AGAPFELELAFLLRGGDHLGECRARLGAARRAGEGTGEQAGQQKRRGAHQAEASVFSSCMLASKEMMPRSWRSTATGSRPASTSAIASSSILRNSTMPRSVVPSVSSERSAI